MDTPIKLRNSKTEQECDFDTEEAVNNFGRNVADREDWHLAGEGATIGSPEEVHAETEIPVLTASVTGLIATADAPDAGAIDSLTPATPGA